MGLTGIRIQRLPPQQVPFVELVSLCVFFYVFATRILNTRNGSKIVLIREVNSMRVEKNPFIIILFIFNYVQFLSYLIVFERNIMIDTFKKRNVKQINRHDITQKKNKCQMKTYILKLMRSLFRIYAKQFIIFLEEFNNFKFQQYYSLNLILEMSPQEYIII